MLECWVPQSFCLQNNTFTKSCSKLFPAIGISKQLYHESSPMLYQFCINITMDITMETGLTIFPFMSSKQSFNAGKLPHVQSHNTEILQPKIPISGASIDALLWRTLPALAVFTTCLPPATSLKSRHVVTRSLTFSTPLSKRTLTSSSHSRQQLQLQHTLPELPNSTYLRLP